MIFGAMLNLCLSLFFYKVIRAPIMRGYLVVNLILITNPAFLYIFFGLAHPKFIPDDESYAVALFYMAAFNLTLCFCYLVFVNSVSRVKGLSHHLIYNRLNSVLPERRAILMVLFLAAVGLIAKGQLQSLGSFRMMEIGSAGPLLQFTKVIATFDILALLILSEIRVIKARRLRFVDVAFVSLGLVSITAAVLSGSRAQIVIVLLVLLLSFRQTLRRYWYFALPAMLTTIPFVFVIFPVIGFWRVSGYDYAEALDLYRQQGANTTDIASDVLVTRLNYLEPLARAISYVDVNGSAGGEVYWNNIVGLIPRLLWSGKPEITNNSRELGHQLGLVNSVDETTSIGLQVVGESFIEYGWLGLGVAVVQAFIFANVHKNFYMPGRPAVMGVYVFLILYLLQRDGYFALIPGVVWSGIGIAIFFVAHKTLTPSRKGANRLR